jgi:hypothetical protein
MNHSKYTQWEARHNLNITTSHFINSPIETR